MAQVHAAPAATPPLQHRRATGRFLERCPVAATWRVAFLCKENWCCGSCPHATHSDPQRPAAANLDSQIDGSVCGNIGKAPAMHGEAWCVHWRHRQGAAWVSVPMPSPFVPMPVLLVGRLPVLHSSPRDIAGLPVALCVSVAAPHGRLKRKRGEGREVVAWCHGIFASHPPTPETHPNAAPGAPEQPREQPWAKRTCTKPRVAWDFGFNAHQSSRQAPRA